jgi:HTH-type transcriptional regulator/antitoxin HigA
MTTTTILKTETEYEAALRETERLVALDPASGTPEADRLELLAVLVSDYESRHFQFPAADPIEAIRFRMEQMGLARRDLIPYIGSKSKVSEVLARKRRLTLSMIRALSAGLGIPAPVLVQEPPKPQETDTDWGQFPIREMATRGYFGVGVVPKGKELKAAAAVLVKEFLGPVGSRAVLAFPKQSQHVRTARSFDKYALYAWTVQVLRRALTRRPKVTYKPGTVDFGFMRQVGQLSWSSQGPRLAQEFLEQHGVSLIIERHMPKTYLDGAALWADKDHPVIGMTLRYDRIDNFWFCLMHELAHVGLHLQDAVYWDDLELKNADPRETEADEMAREALVPKDAWENSAARHVRSPDAVRQLAKRLNVHPAVVAGRVRFESDDYTVLNSLLGHGEVQRLFPEHEGAEGVKR